MTSSPLNWRSFSALVGMAVLFGASFTATKIALGQSENLGVFTLLCIRLGIALCLVFPTFMVFGRPIKLPRGKSLWTVVGLAILEPGAYYIFETIGIHYTTPDRAAIVISTIPFFLLGLGALVLKEKVTGAEWLWVGVGFAGLAAVLTGGEMAGGRFLGDGLCLVAAILASVYSILVRIFSKVHHFLFITLLQTVIGLVLYLPLAAWEISRNTPVLHAPAWGAILFLGVGCSYGAYVLMNYSLSRVEARVLSPFINLVPAVGMFIPWLIWTYAPDLLPDFKKITNVQLVSAVLVILSLFMVQRVQRKQRLKQSGA